MVILLSGMKFEVVLFSQALRTYPLQVGYWKNLIGEESFLR